MQSQESSYRKLVEFNNVYKIWNVSDIYQLVNKLTITEMRLLADSNGVEETRNIIGKIFDRLDRV